MSPPRMLRQVVSGSTAAFVYTSLRSRDNLASELLVEPAGVPRIATAALMPAAGGIHIQTIVLRRFADETAARVRLRSAATRTRTFWGHTMLINAGLWLILVAMIALLPIGC